MIIFLVHIKFLLHFEVNVVEVKIIVENRNVFERKNLR